jgi:hypothetical protein
MHIETTGFNNGRQQTTKSSFKMPPNRKKVGGLFYGAFLITRPHRFEDRMIGE